MEIDFEVGGCVRSARPWHRSWNSLVLLERRKVFPKYDLNPDNCPICLLSRNLLKTPSIRRVYFDRRAENHIHNQGKQIERKQTIYEEDYRLCMNTFHLRRLLSRSESIVSSYLRCNMAECQVNAPVWYAVLRIARSYEIVYAQYNM